ncbi:AMP-dependent synthetase/ligase [Bifidobacterium aquikefiri]|uniref:AMP-dependent synthetase/ligase n=1 Tax=Bifidobacterium aquikefiri TaxID=1653207 RepID=UPI0039E950A9
MLREFNVKTNRPTTDDDTVYSLLSNRSKRDPEDVIAQWQDENTKAWHDVTAEQMLDRVRQVAKGLLALGVTKGSKIIIYSATSYDWGIVDFACAAIGAVTVPIYETDSSKQASAITQAVDPVVAFAGDNDHTQIMEQVRLDDNKLKFVFNFENDGLNAVSDFGKAVTDETLDEGIADVHADDLLTIVYTSGSTGKPKGVMLSNRNFAHIVYAGYEALPDMLAAPTRLLLFLPLAHCFARYIQYVCIGAQGVVGYVPNAKHLLADLRSFKPTYLLGVPRVFEKVYNAASQKAGAGFKGRLFANAFKHFIQWSKDEQESGRHGVIARMHHSFYMRTVGSSIRSALGPNLKYLACGGAPMNADLANFFNGFDGITFIQGYGMTETAAPCCVNGEHDNIVGSVGRPGPGISVRIADDDELLVKGPNVFVGYYGQPELGQDTVDADGWLHTGDLAQLNDEGFVFITGRKKDIIITAGGKNISPAPMEDTIASCPIVSQAVVVGDGKPFIAGLVTLDPDMLKNWLESQKLDSSLTLAQAVSNEAVRSYIQQFVDQANSSVSRAESVRKFLILDEDFTQEDGTLTPSMKVVRPQVLRKYENLIDKVLYAPRAGQPRPVPASAKLMERASESITPLVNKAQENAMPRINEMLGSIDRARSNVSDSLANVSERIRSQAEQNSSADSRPSSHEEGSDAHDGNTKDSDI